MTKCKNPGEKKSLSKCLAVLKVKWFLWSGAAACTEESERDFPGVQPTAQPSSPRLLWLLKSERKCSGLTCPLARLQPLRKRPNILLPPRFLHFVLHVPWLGGCCKSCPEKMGCSRGWRCRAVAAAAAAGLGARRVG